MLATGASACGEPARVYTETVTRHFADEAESPDQVCTDVGDERVCWRDDRPVRVPRVLPAPASFVPPGGWRCGVQGRQRVCEDRTRNASAFDCGTQRCLQARPRMPDDGEWECVEISGVVYCHSRGPAAGVNAGPSDLGWLCGPRRGGTKDERICVDFDADRPRAVEPAGVAQRCRFEPHMGMPRRICTPERALQVGSACTGASACPEGSACRDGLCLPERPEPACFFDRDCGDGVRCVFGSCRGA